MCGAGLQRTADALLKALGEETVSLLLPATATASDAAGQLGLVDPGVQEVVDFSSDLAGTVTGNLGPRRRVEFTLPASAITGSTSCARDGHSGDLFSAMLGLTYGGDLFHVEPGAGEFRGDCLLLCGYGCGVTRIAFGLKNHSRTGEARNTEGN